MAGAGSAATPSIPSALATRRRRRPDRLRHATSRFRDQAQASQRRGARCGVDGHLGAASRVAYECGQGERVLRHGCGCRPHHTDHERLDRRLVDLPAMRASSSSFSHGRVVQVRYLPPARLCYDGGADGDIPAACGCGLSPPGVRIAARRQDRDGARGPGDDPVVRAGADPPGGAPSRRRGPYAIVGRRGLTATHSAPYPIESVV